MTAIVAPGRSLEQRREALQGANEIRSKRAEFKRDLKAGRASLALALMEPPEWMETAKIVGLLLACPKLGRVKVDKIMRLCRISPSKTVSGISPRQRAELVGCIAANSGSPTPGACHQEREQVMRALAGANAIRTTRSQLKLEIALGTRTVVSVLAHVPREAESMTIANLVACQHRWGTNRTRRLLTRNGIPEAKQVGALTRRQRDAITAALTAPAGRPQTTQPTPPRPAGLVRAAETCATPLRTLGGVLHVVGIDDHYTPCGLASWEIPDATAAEWHDQDACCRKCERAVDAKGMVVVDVLRQAA